MPYTKVNRLILLVLEIDYLRKEKKNPDVMMITETKLCDSIDAFNLGDGKYSVRKRNGENK